MNIRLPRFTVLTVCCVFVVALLAATGTSSATAIATGAYLNLTFPSCGSALETGGSVAWYSGGTLTEIATDATGAQIGSITVFVPAGTYFNTTFPISSTSYKNPLTMSYNVNGIPLFTLTANSPCASSSTVYAFPTPSSSTSVSFVLRTITCTVAIFDRPDGQQLSSGDKIIGGQTWFVNPIPVSVANYRQFPLWTEVFIGGPQNGFIPTVCVG